MTNPTESQVTELRAAIDALMRRFKIAEAEVSPSKPLNQIDLHTLQFVRANPACGPTDVARYLGVATTTISSVTDRLARQGLLHRDRPEDDRRAVALSLAAAGEKYVAALIDTQKKHCRTMLESLSSEEQTAFLALLAKIASSEH
jgi:DNA-binding MarR family transcriptional regulator